MARIFHVRINLDAVSADLNTLVDDKERGEWLRGFMAGAAGGANRFVDTSPSYLGWCLGASARGHAEQFHEKQAAYGVKSAEARKAKYGTAQPERPSEGGSKVVRTTFEPDSNLSNNPIIEEENKPKIHKPKIADAQFDIFWDTYGKKTGKPVALKAWAKLSEDDRNSAVGGIPGYHAMREPTYRLDPVRYLNRRTWEDEAYQSMPVPVACDYGEPPAMILPPRRSAL